MRRLVIPLVIVSLVAAGAATTAALLRKDRAKLEPAQKGVFVGDIADEGSVIAISPEGKARVVASGFERPTGLARAKDGTLYVAQADAIIKVEPASGAKSRFADFAKPYDLYIAPDGVLYAAGRPFADRPHVSGVFKIEAGKEPDPVFDDNEPCTEVAVTPKGKIWIADIASDTLTRMGKDYETSCKLTQLGGSSDIVSEPSGQVLVSSLGRNRIMRVDGDKRKNWTVFSPIPSPSAIFLDEAGRIYAASSATASVYRIDAKGELQIIAYGVASPQALAVAPDGTVYVLCGLPPRDRRKFEEQWVRRVRPRQPGEAARAPRRRLTHRSA